MDPTMIATPWLALAYAVTSTFIAFLITCIANGILKSSKDDAMASRLITSGLTFLLSGFGFLMYLVTARYGDSVPIEYLWSTGVLGSFKTLMWMAIGATASGAAFYGLAKVGNWISRGTEALGSLFGRSKKQSAPEKMELPALPITETIKLSDVYAQFSTVKTLCESLRNQLKEGASYTSLGTLMEELDRVRAAIDDENKKSIVPVLMSDYIEPTELGLKAYERLLKRNVSTADAMVSEMQEKTLPLMLEKIQSIYGQIHVGDIATLSTVASKLETARPLTVSIEAEAQAEARL